jgi:hypothetical protein
MVVKFRNSICPPPPQLSLHRRAALSNNSNGLRSVYSRKNPKKQYTYIAKCLWESNVFPVNIRVVEDSFKILNGKVKELEWEFVHK